MSGLREALGFLTRIPVSAEGPPGRAAVPWFPVVGAAVGAFVGGVYAAAYQIMPSPLAALAAVVSGVLVTGAFHEDGFADTADALGSRRTGESGIEVMRDSRLGTYGSIAIVVSILWRVLAIGAMDPIAALVGLVMAHTLGRATSVTLMATTTAARQEGLGRVGVLGVTGPGAAIGITTGLFVSGLAGGWWLGPAVVVASVCLLWLRGITISRFSGITGDVLGAGEQLSELAVLTVVAVVTWGGSDVWWVS